MNIVLVGCGKIGVSIIDELSSEGHDIVVIDSNKTILNAVSVKYDVNVIVGNGANADVQKDAGVKDSEIFIACTDRDEINVLSCLVAKKLSKKIKTIARIRNPEYGDFFDSSDLGIDLLINPEQEIANEMFRALRFPSALKVEPFVDGKVEIFELLIEKDSPLINCSLQDLKSKYDISILICAINRNGNVIVPKGMYELHEGDIIYVTATSKDAEQMFKKLKMWKKRLKTILITGGGKVTHYLCSLFKRMGNEIKIIESDLGVCTELASEFPKVTVINRDDQDLEVLSDEGLSEADAYLSLLEDTEDNAIMALYARSIGVNRVMTTIDKPILNDMLQKQQISILSPMGPAANQIVRYVRGQSNAISGAIKALYRIIDGEAEVLEFCVEESFKLLDMPLKDGKFIDNTLIAAILRDNELIIPNGFDHIAVGDRILVVTTGTQILELNDIVL